MQHPKPFSSANSTIKQLINFYWHTHTHNKTKVKFAKPKQREERREERRREGKPASACNFSASRLTGSQKLKLYSRGTFVRLPLQERGTVHCVCRNSINLTGRIYLRMAIATGRAGEAGSRTHAQAAGKDRGNEANSMAIHTPLSIAGRWL